MLTQCYWQVSSTLDLLKGFALFTVFRSTFSCLRLFILILMLVLLSKSLSSRSLLDYSLTLILLLLLIDSNFLSLELWFLVLEFLLSLVFLFSFFLRLCFDFLLFNKLLLSFFSLEFECGFFDSTVVTLSNLLKFGSEFLIFALLTFAFGLVLFSLEWCKQVISLLTCLIISNLKHFEQFNSFTVFLHYWDRKWRVPF